MKIATPTLRSVDVVEGVGRDVGSVARQHEVEQVRAHGCRHVGAHRLVQVTRDALLRGTVHQTLPAGRRVSGQVRVNVFCTLPCERHWGTPVYKL